MLVSSCPGGLIRAFEGSYSNSDPETIHNFAARPVAERRREHRSFDWRGNGGRRMSLHDADVYSFPLWQFRQGTHGLGKFRALLAVSANSTLRDISNPYQRCPLEDCVHSCDYLTTRCRFDSGAALVLPIASHVFWLDAIEQIVGPEPH